MKGPTLLVAPLAAYLVQTAVTQNYPDLLSSCDGLTVDPDTSILSGECQAGGDPALTYVDLNKCLGWGAHINPGRLYNIKPVSPVNALTPVENGNFTKNCHPCYFIPRDEGGQAAAHLMCSCSPEGSEFKTEYTFDLTDIVDVTNHGCLECMGASGVCAPEVRLDPSKGVAPGDLDRDRSNAVNELLDWLKIRAQAERTPCENNIIPKPIRLLPATWKNTTYHRCKGDHSLCCFQTSGWGCNSDFEGFQLIESHEYWYRVHYAISYLTLTIDSLGRVYQFCKYPGQCEDETTLDETSGVPPCNRTDTDNPMEPYEKYIYDDGSDTLSSQTAVLPNLGAKTTLLSGSMSVHFGQTIDFQTRTKASNKKEAS